MVLGTTWQVITNGVQADKASPPVDAIIPKEGSTAWSDSWMVYSKTKHPNCSYKWLNWITKPDVQAQVAEYFGEAPANLKACDVTSTTGPLHDVPRRRPGVLRPALVLEDADEEVPRRSHRHRVRRLQGLDAGVGRDQGQLSRDRRQWGRADRPAPTASRRPASRGVLARRARAAPAASSSPRPLAWLTRRLRRLARRAPRHVAVPTTKTIRPGSSRGSTRRSRSRTSTGCWTAACTARSRCGRSAPRSPSRSSTR